VSLKTIFSRSGEWGDHVTLQAAADKVNSLFYAMFLTSFALLNFHATYGIIATHLAIVLLCKWLLLFSYLTEIQNKDNICCLWYSLRI